jgi:hypothetical protein
MVEIAASYTSNQEFESETGGKKDESVRSS